MKLIRNPATGEKCLVESLEGYDGWEVVADGVRKPEPGEYWCEDDSEWKSLPAPELTDRVRNPDELAAIIAELQAQLAALQEQKG